MKDDYSYWDDLISGLHDPDNNNAEKKALFGRFGEAESDLHWARAVKSQLQKVFLWDLFDKKEAKLRLEYRLRKHEYPVIQLSRRIWLRAAVILIAIISGAILHAILPGSFTETRYTEIFVPPGQMTQVKLSDGSKIWLNSGSVFKYPIEFDQSSRKVFIDGEAFMEVTHNKRKPFVVNTGKLSVEVLGTSFNISAYSGDEHTNITLVDGSVLLRSDDEKWTRNMAPGQSITVANNNTPEISMVNTDFYTSWKDGKIVFRNEKLEEIAKKMERWYNVEIRFKDEKLKELEFSGTFLKYKPIEQVFRSLSIMNDHIDFVYENRTDQKNLIYIINKTN